MIWTQKKPLYLCFLKKPAFLLHWATFLEETDFWLRSTLAHGTSSFLVFNFEHHKTFFLFEWAMILKLKFHFLMIQNFNKWWTENKKHCLLKNISFLPDLHYFLISVERLFSNGFQVSFSNNQVKINDGNKLSAAGSRRSSLYVLEAAITEGVLYASLNTQHARLSHADWKAIYKCPRAKLVKKCRLVTKRWTRSAQFVPSLGKLPTSSQGHLIRVPQKYWNVSTPMLAVQSI